ncbi:MAG: dihydroorotase [Limnobacter sp.]|nr:dihydroorotase [Limnobacter sp.]
MLSDFEITQPDDWHVHLRDGEGLQYVAPATAARFGRAIVMPNLKPPITDVGLAKGYRARILKALAEVHEAAQVSSAEVGLATGYSPLELEAMQAFEPLMVLYLTGSTSANTILEAAASDCVKAVKLYPAGATTNSDAGVSDLLGQCTQALAAMQECGLPLLVHGEVTDAAVDVFDRESRFIETVMKPLRERFPALRVVFEHITTRQAAQYVQQECTSDSSGRPLLGATITPQHLLFNRNALFKGGLQPHWYCLPVLKREEHRLALLDVATSGRPEFFLGTDSAPHARHLKEMACGCAGCYSAPFALEMYALAFEQAGALPSTEVFEQFCALNGPAFYDLPVNARKVRFQRVEQRIPHELPFSYGSGAGIVPFMAGEELPWRVDLVG